MHVSRPFAYEPRLTITNNCYGERTVGVGDSDAVVEGYLAKQRHERVRVVRAMRFRELSLKRCTEAAEAKRVRRRRSRQLFHFAHTRRLQHRSLPVTQ